LGILKSPDSENQGLISILIKLYQRC
jgi:hypothetical protein